MKRTFILLVAFSMMLIVTTSLSAQGVYEAWVARYNGPANGSDGVSDMVIDASGNVIVTGASFGSGTNSDYVTIKYYPNGDTAWVRRYNGAGNGDDYATAIKVDITGNACVTGVSDRDASFGINNDYTTIKYTPNGDTLWVRSYNGPKNGTDEASDLTVDAGGNVYVTGFSYGSDTDRDYATIKYSPDGETIWVRRYNGPAGYYDYSTALVVDNSGNAYVTGFSFGYGTYEDYTTIKYAPDGDTLWVRSYNGVEGYSCDDRATALAVDSSGNVYVTGYGGICPSHNFFIATIKYGPNGDVIWIRRYENPSNAYDRANALKVDKSTNVYVAGSSCTIKYKPDGDTAWIRPYGANTANALAVDDSGDVYLTTGFEGYTIIKYYSNGDSAWVRRYYGPGYDYDLARTLAVDGSGNVYVSGISDSDTSSSFNFDCATVKYSPCVKSGELNADGKANVTDVVYLVNILFKSWAIPGPDCLADVNGDSLLSLGDVVYLANHVFKSGPAPVVSGACCQTIQ